MNGVVRTARGMGWMAILLVGIGVGEAWAAQEGARRAEADRKPPFGVKVVGTGRPMLLIPGLFNAGEVWDTTVAHFRPRYECHVLTLAGFAGQPPVEGPFMERMRAAIVDYIRAKKLERPILVGHSLGGFMVFLLGATEPELVGPIIAVDGLPCMPAMLNPQVTDEELKQGEKIGQSLASATREAFLQQNRQMMSLWISDPARLERVMKWAEASDQATVARALGELWTRDLRGEVAKIKTPVLLIAAPGPGEAREALTKLYHDQVARVPQKKVVVAESARHFVMFDAPEWLWKQMEAFLAGR